MVNNYVLQRLAGIQSILNGVHQASACMSASSRGQEREAFIDKFLGNVLPPVYRFGTGDATDSSGNRSGQLDVVVEYPIAPSLPALSSGTRLYLAESVAAVIEVKSNAANQWDEAIKTANKLLPLQRDFGTTMVMGQSPSTNIPLFVVGYTGWATLDTLKNKLTEFPQVAGILIIDKGLFVSSGGMTATGPLALWALIISLHDIASGLKAAGPNLAAYAV